MSFPCYKVRLFNSELRGNEIQLLIDDQGDIFGHGHSRIWVCIFFSFARKLPERNLRREIICASGFGGSCSSVQDIETIRIEICS